MRDIDLEAAKQIEPSREDLEDMLRAAGFTKLANMERRTKRLLSQLRQCNG